jgi:hypothetical protein
LLSFLIFGILNTGGGAKMIEQMADYIHDQLLENRIEVSEKEAFISGLQVLLSESIILACLSVIALVSKSYYEVITFIGVCLLIRKSNDVYHMHTPEKCVLLTLTLFLLTLLITPIVKAHTYLFLVLTLLLTCFGTGCFIHKAYKRRLSQTLQVSLQVALVLLVALIGSVLAINVTYVLSALFILLLTIK